MPNQIHYRKIAIAVLVIAFLLLTACSSGSGSGSGNEPVQPSQPSSSQDQASQTNQPEADSTKLTPVSVGLLYLTADAGMFIAQERGYFQEQGLEVKFERFKSAADIVSLLATGKLDVGSGSVTPGLYNSFSQGMDVKIVSGKSNIQANHGDGDMVVSKSLYESGEVTKVADLKGKKIAVNNIHTTSMNYVLRPLKIAGLTVDDVEVVEIPFNQMIAALSNHSIDAAMLYSPLNDVVENRGLAVKLPETNLAVTSDQDETNLMFYSNQFASSEVAKKFMVAHTKGLRDYHRSIVDGKANQNEIDEIYAIVGKYTETDPAELKKHTMPGVDPDGNFRIESLENYQKEWLEWGYQKTPADLSQNIDKQFVEYAVTQLGPYK